MFLFTPNYETQKLREFLRFVIGGIEGILSSNPTSANLILTNKIFTLTELFFDIRQMWTLAPKQRLEEIQKISPDFYALLRDFCQERITLKDKVDVARKITLLVFKNINTESKSEGY